MNDLLKTKSFLSVILVVFVFVLYSFMLQGNFKTLDDESSIVRNVWIKDFRYTGEILKSSYFGVNDYYRPLVSLSYMLEYHFFGLNAFWYYIDNILIHCATSILLFLIFIFLFPSQRLAFAAAFLYAIHPVHWEAVSNISGRAILLCGFFSVSSLWFFLQRKKSPILYLFSVGALALGLLCKESAGVFPAVLLSYQFFLGRTKQDKLRNWIVPVLPFFLLLIPYSWLRVHLGITELFYPRDSGEWLLGFLTFLRGLMTYVRLFFVPVDLHFDRSSRFLMGLVNADVLLILIFYGLAGWLLFKYRRKISLLAWFLLSWFLIDLIPVSQVLVPVGIQPGYISLAEHFLYTAAIGFWGLVVLAVDGFYRWNVRRQIFSPGILALAVIFFCGSLMLALIEINIYSSSEIAMLERTARMAPNNGRNQLSLASAYTKNRRFAEAEKSFRQGLKIDPDMNTRAQIGLGKSLCDQGKLWQGLEVYDSVRDAKKLQLLLDENRDVALRLLRQKYEALAAAEPNNPDYRYAMGVVYAKIGENKKAILEFQAALELKPDYREGWFNLASTLALQNEWNDAILAYEKVLRLTPQDDLLAFQANQFLSRIYKTLDNSAKADEHEKEAGRILAIIEKKR